jgi:hypothetical protein
VGKFLQEETEETERKGTFFAACLVFLRLLCLLLFKSIGCGWPRCASVVYFFISPSAYFAYFAVKLPIFLLCSLALFRGRIPGLDLAVPITILPDELVGGDAAPAAAAATNNPASPAPANPPPPPPEDGNPAAK